jgi:hypothetical protein
MIFEYSSSFVFPLVSTGWNPALSSTYQTVSDSASRLHAHNHMELVVPSHGPIRMGGNR